MSDRVIGWDLGGAHLKVAVLDPGGRINQVHQLACRLWLGLPQLDAAIRRVFRSLPAERAHHAITMTAELVDLFETRAEGVRTLVREMAARLPQKSIRIYAGRSGFVDVQAALQRTDEVASANWMASASVAAARIAQGLMLDVGSTTTDLLAFDSGTVHARGHTDYERLRSEELLYTGVVRTPGMMLSPQVPFEGEWVPLVAEQFATAADVYRILALLPEHADMMPTADGGPKSNAASMRRLARMLGRDMSSAQGDAWVEVAAYLSECQLEQIYRACRRLLSRGLIEPSAPIVGAGVGRFMAQRVAERLRRPYLDFGSLFEGRSSTNFGPAECAPAVAVAALAQQQVWA